MPEQYTKHLNKSSIIKPLLFQNKQLINGAKFYREIKSNLI